jgi:uracil-DNA glycosylase
MSSAADAGAEALIPPRRGGVKALREAAAGCRACPLWRNATQTVFGAGRARAPVMLVGEQPGDREDRDGRPFVGPAGHLLDAAMEKAGLDPDRVYVTNAVKHFKWKPRGKRRIHQRPSKLEMEACKPWLEGELDRVRPEVVGILGSVAAESLIGGDFRVTKRRGELIEVNFAPAAVATVHPSAVLRSRDSEERAVEFDKLVDDLRVIVRAV